MPRALGAVALLLVSLLPLPVLQDAPEGPRPDILLIVVDDLNDWVGHLGGHPNARTPGIDALAARGIAFTNAHCASPVCNPSRTAMFGGLRPGRTEARIGQGWRETLAGVATLTDHFAAQGYVRLGTGKLFHGSVEDQFDEYHRVRQDSGDLVRPRMYEGYVDLGLDIANSEGFDWHAFRVDDSAMPDHRRVDWAIERLGEERDQPLFLALGFHMPHLPWYVPERYFELHPREGIRLPEVREDDLDDVPPAARELVASDRIHPRVVAAGEWENAIQAYLAACSFVDAEVGRLIDALDRSPRRDRTVVLLTSDHGWHLGEKQHWRKQTLWEDATRVPLIVVPPEYEHAGTLCAKPVDTLSVYATLCDLAGVPTPGHVEGPSLAPLIADPTVEWEHAALTTLRNHHHSLRTERWRYTRYADGSEELYDHEVDPHEFVNLAGDEEMAQVLKGLRRRLMRMK